MFLLLTTKSHKKTCGTAGYCITQTRGNNLFVGDYFQRWTNTLHNVSGSRTVGLSQNNLE